MRAAGDEHQLADPGRDDRLDRVRDHRAVVDRQQVLVRDPRQRMEAATGAAGEDDSLHVRKIVRPRDPQRRTTSQSEETRSAASTLATSRPGPQLSSSASPSAAASRSFPGPPRSLSSPGPPKRRSRPRPPESRSAPAPADTRSCPRRANASSGPAVPRIVSSIAPSQAARGDGPLAGAVRADHVDAGEAVVERHRPVVGSARNEICRPSGDQSAPLPSASGRSSPSGEPTKSRPARE